MEDLTLTDAEFADIIGDYSFDRIRFLECQSCTVSDPLAGAFSFQFNAEPDIVGAVAQVMGSVYDQLATAWVTYGAPFITNALS